MTVALLAQEAPSSTLPMPVRPCLSEVVEAIGGDEFTERLLDFLTRLVGADHCAVFQLTQYELREVASACLAGACVTKSDLTHYEVKRQLSQIGSPRARVDVYTLADPGGLRSGNVTKRQRIMICAQKATASFCLRILRSAPRDSISEAETDSLRQVADVLISLVARHVDLLVRKPNLTPALTSLDAIQDCLLNSTDLSRREGEVCARILYGLSSCGIALDLGIGKESVMTYRKRAYQRLGIGSQRELLMWYLAQWSSVHRKSSDAPAAFN